MINIIIQPSAMRDIKKLDKDLKRKVKQALLEFAASKSTDLKKLKGSKNTYRIRVNEYRIVLQLVIIENTAYVIRVGHRREVYKNLP